MSASQACRFIPTGCLRQVAARLRTYRAWSVRYWRSRLWLPSFCTFLLTASVAERLRSRSMFLDRLLSVWTQDARPALFFSFLLHFSSVPAFAAAATIMK